MAWIKKGSKTEYLEFIGGIDAFIFKNPIGIMAAKKCCWLRHDVDYDINHALNFAEYEAKNERFSTYFLLHTAPYFNYSFDLKVKIRALSQMGHEIGLHNDIISVWYNSLGTINFKQRIRDIIDFMESCDIRVTGTSCHGSKEHYDRCYFNYQIWKDFNINKNEGLGKDFGSLFLKDVGLFYEAYFLPYTHYFSDSGNNWIGYVVDGQKPFERTALQSPNNLGSNVIEEFNKCDSGFLHVLTHPCHYEEV